MRGPRLPHELSRCDTSLLEKNARVAGRWRIENVHRNPEMQEQLVAGPRTRDESKRHRGAVREASGTCAAFVPHLGEPADRAEAHQASTSTLSITTPVAPGDPRSPS